MTAWKSQGAASRYSTPKMKGAQHAAPLQGRLEWVRGLPAHLEGKLELARIVGRCWLARNASRARGWIANLIDRGNVGAIEEVEGVGDEIELEAFAERNAFGEAHVPLKEVG